MHRARLAGIHEWQLKGRMAVRTSFRSGTATVVWNRATSADELDLFGPFGSGHVRISSKSDGAVMTDAKKVVKRAASLRELLYSEAGWPVPFDSLKYWLIGAPVPQIRAEWRIDENGRLAWLRQAGWYISFDDYRDRAGIQIPRRIRMEALPGTASLTFPDGRISDELVVKLVISELATASIPGHGNFSRTSQD